MVKPKVALTLGALEAFEWENDGDAGVKLEQYLEDFTLYKGAMGLECPVQIKSLFHHKGGPQLRQVVKNDETITPLHCSSRLQQSTNSTAPTTQQVAIQTNQLVVSPTNIIVATTWLNRNWTPHLVHHIIEHREQNHIVIKPTETKTKTQLLLTVQPTKEKLIC